MPNISEYFDGIFNSEHVPSLTQNSISIIQSFLAYSLDSEFQERSSLIISFFEQHLRNLHQLNQGNLNKNDEELYSTLISMLSYLRPSYITSDFFHFAEQSALEFLNNSTNLIQQASFSFLCTHYIHQREHLNNEIVNLFHWIQSYFSNCISSFKSINVQFFVIITTSIESLLEKYIGPQDHNPQNKNPNQQQIIKQKVQSLPDILTYLIELAYQGLISYSQSFLPNEETIINKTLKLIQRYLDSLTTPTQSHLEKLIQMITQIPDDCRFFHIKENLLMIAFLIAEIPGDFQHKTEFCNYAKTTSLNLLSHFQLFPLSIKRRLNAFLKRLCKFAKLQSKSDLFHITSDSLWPLFANSQIPYQSHEYAVYYFFFIVDILPDDATYILRELVNCFDFLKTDFETSADNFEFRYWIQAHIHLLKSTEKLLRDESRILDATKEKMQNPIERSPLYTKLIKHFRFVLTALTYSPTSETTKDLIKSFGNIIMLILRQSPVYIQENMIYLLPFPTEKSFHDKLNLYILQTLNNNNNNQSPKSHYYYFYCKCFFDTLLNNFDSLFETTPTYLLKIIDIFIMSAFPEEEPSAAQQPSPQHNELCFALYKFFLRCFNLRDAVVFKLLIRIINLSSKRPRLGPFIQRFRESPFSIPNVISYLCEDPRIEPHASLLAIFLYSFCNSKPSSISTPEAHAEWYRLFIPAIESDQFNSIIPFYRATVKQIAELLPKFPKPLQYRLVTSLALLLGKFKGSSDINLVINELGQIPLIATELSRSPHNEINSTNTKCMVNINDIDIDLNVIKDTLKKFQPSEVLSTIDAHCKLFEAAVYQIDFQDAVASDAIDLLAGRVCHDRIDFIRELTGKIIFELNSLQPPLQESIPSDELIDENTDQKKAQEIKVAYNILDRMPTIKYAFDKRSLLKSLRTLFYYRVKYITSCGTRKLKDSSDNENDLKMDKDNQSNHDDSKTDKSERKGKSEKDDSKNEELFESETKETMQSEIIQMFEDLEQDSMKLSFLNEFLILVNTKPTAMTALKAIEIMTNNYDYFPIIRTINSAAVWGAHFDYYTSKKILTKSVFELIKKHLSMSPEPSEAIEQVESIPYEVKKELNYFYLQSCRGPCQNIVKLALKGLKFLETHQLLMADVSEYRKKFASQIAYYVSKNQRYYVNFIFFKPFDDIISDEYKPIICVNNMITQFESIHQKNKTHFLKEAIKLVNATRSYDTGLSLYYNAKFYAKAIAYYLAVLPATSDTQKLWERMITLLRDSKCRHFYSYFLKQISKNHPEPSMPLECNVLLNPLYNFSQQANKPNQQTNPQNTFVPTVNDFELLRLILIHSSQKLNQQVIETMLNTYLTFIARNPTLLVTNDLQNNNATLAPAEQIGLKILEIIKTARIDLRKIIPTAYEASVMTAASKEPIKLPLNMICERFANIIVYVFTMSQKRNWINGSFSMFTELLKDDSLTELRALTIEKLKNELTLQTAREYESKLNLPFVANCFLSAAASITNSLNCTYQMFVDVIEIVQKFLPLLIQPNENYVKYRPSIFMPMIELCFPNVSDLLRQYNQTQKFNQPHQQILTKALEKNKVFAMNQNLRNTYLVTNVLIPFFLNNPRLFLQHLFVDRFCYFIKFLFTEFDERHSIYVCIESYCKSCENAYSKVLAWLMLNSYIKHFPEDLPKIFYQSTFHANFESFPLSPMIPSYILHATASLMSIKKINDQFITIDDFDQNKMIHVDSTIAAIATFSNHLTLDHCLTVSRLFNLLRFLIRAKIDFDFSMYFDHLIRLLKNIPLFTKPALNTFQYFSPNEIKIDEDERAALFSTLFIFVNFNKKLSIPDYLKKDIPLIPKIFKRVANVDFLPRRAFELLINCASLLINMPNDSMNYVYMIDDGVFAKLLDKLDPKELFELIPNLNEFVSKFKTKLSAENQSADISLRISMNLFASFSKIILFGDPTYCPPFLRPKVVFDFLSKYQNEYYFSYIYKNYKRALRNCFDVSGIQYKSLLINELYELLRQQFKSFSLKPLKTPLATICMWLSVPLNDSRFVTFISSYLKIFNPKNDVETKIELLNMRQPFSHLVEEFIFDLADKNDEMKEFAMNCPNVRPIFFSTVNEMSLCEICWSTKWNESHVKTHLYSFAKFIMPNFFTVLVKFFDIKGMTEIVITALHSASNKDLEKFAEYYTSFYPKSYLTDCFAVVFNLFGNKTPLPYQTPFEAMQYLENRSYYDDSLGILKTHFPEYLAAASYHQISNYEAAKIHYLRTMDQHHDTYFYGLHFLRSCQMNLSLAKTTIPLEMLSDKDITSSVIQSFTNGHEFTTTFSPSYLCLVFSFLLHATLHTANDQMQGKPTDSSEMMRKWTLTMMKTLDKEGANVINYAIRFSIFHSYQSLGEATMLPIVQEANRWNRQSISRLLMESGSPRLALKQFDISLNIHAPLLQTPQSTPQIPQQASNNLLAYNTAQQSIAHVINNTRSELSLKSFKINPANLPRIKHFLMKKNVTGSSLLQFRIRKELRDITALEFIVKFENLYAQQTQQMKSMYSPQLTTQSSQFPQLINNNTKSIVIANQMWTDVLASLVSESEITDELQVFTRIQNELGPKRITETGKINRTNYLIALAISIIRFESQFQKAFVSTLLVNNLPDDVKFQWLNWLPILLITLKEKLPEEFLNDLYKFQPVWFYMIFQTYKRPFMEEFWQQTKAIKDNPKQKYEFENCFSWMSKYKDDIQSYFYNYQLRNDYYAVLTQPNAHHHSMALFDNSIEKLAEYCDSHPCVLMTKNPIPEKQTNGFKFPTVVSPVVAVSVKTDGINEACVKFVSLSGDIKKFSLVLNTIYRFRVQESLFMYGLQKIFDRYLSSRTKSSFVFYPKSFRYLHFCFVSEYPLIGMQKITHDNHYDLYLLRAYQKRKDIELDNTPLSSTILKQNDFPKDVFPKFFSKLTKGNLNDFLFARQSFASHLALNIVLRKIINSPQLSAIPSLAIFGNGQRVVIPEFLSVYNSSKLLPITPALKLTLPDYIFHGSFTTTWLSAVDALHQNSDTLRVYLKALLPNCDEKESELNDNEKKNFLKRIVYSSLHTLDKLSTHSQEKTESYDEPFPILAIKHIIDTCDNVFNSHIAGIAWI